MTKKRNIIILFVVGLLCLFTGRAFGAGPAATDTTGHEERSIDVLFPERSRNLDTSHFTWGAEVGSSIDATGHDLTTFNVDVLIGYKNACIKMLGIGAGIHRSIHMGNNLIPVYAVFRSSFRKKPSLLFLDLQAGYSFNTFEDHDTFGDFTSALGLGINLSQTRRAKSYIILSGGYHYINDKHREMVSIDTNSIYVVNLSFGVNF